MKDLIFSGRDEFEYISVIDEGDLRTMYFGEGCSQSEMSKTNPYAIVGEYSKLMAASLLFMPEPKKVLMLGLGGSVLPKFLWKYFPKCHCDIVERSSLVIKLSHQLFALPHSPRIQIYCEDALNYLKRCQERYDLILIDLFQGNGMSKITKHPEFFKQCHTLLKSPRSMLLWNTWITAPQELMKNCIHHLCHCFGSQIMILSHSGNNVFFIFNKEIHIELGKVISKAHRLKQKTGFDFPQLCEDHHFFI